MSLKISTFHNVVGGVVLGCASLYGIGSCASYNTYSDNKKEIAELEKRMVQMPDNKTKEYRTLADKYSELSEEASINKSNLFSGLFLTTIAVGVGMMYISAGKQWKKREQENENYERGEQ